MTKESLSALFGREFTSAKDNWKGKCPFHGGGNERTPSFFVHKEEYIAHCFGCDISGTISSLAALYTGKTEAECSELLGVTLEAKIRRRTDLSQENNERNGKTKKPSKFPESWLGPWRKEIHSYVTRRGFLRETLIAAEARYDPVKKRQVFPWRNSKGDLIGATGRDCTDNSSAKWYHYWDFDRGRHLYSLPKMRLQQGDAQNRPLHTPLLVVEGIFDLLWVYQETGNGRITAPIAAQLSTVQAGSIKLQADTVILGFDNDEAGIRGTEKAYRSLRRSCRIGFIKWPDNAKDWMDLDVRAIRSVLGRPLTYLEWKKWIRERGLEHLTVDTKKHRANR